MLNALGAMGELFPENEELYINAKETLSGSIAAGTFDDLTEEELAKIVKNPLNKYKDILHIIAEKIESKGIQLPDSIITLIEEGHSISGDRMFEYLQSNKETLRATQPKSPKEKKVVQPVTTESPKLDVEIIKLLENERRLSIDNLFNMRVITLQLANGLRVSGLNTKDFRIYADLPESYLLSADVNKIGVKGISTIREILNILEKDLVIPSKDIGSIDSIVTRAALRPRPEQNITVPMAIKIFNASGFSTRTDIYNNLNQVIRSVQRSHEQKEISTTELVNIVNYLEMYKG